jgi:DtxR family Mn-dependent transcriptional regulator
MSSKDISENIEEYLEVLYKEGMNKNHVSTTTISNNLGIAPGSVTQMLKKLELLGYIEYVPYKGAILTDMGLTESQKITRKHRILERFLKDVLKIKDENVHQQACDMEHSLSDEAERALCHMLEHPDICPDNHLIPPCNFDFHNCEECLNDEDEISDIRIRNDNLINISNLAPNQTGDVSFIRGDECTLAKILSHGIAIGTKISYDENDEVTDDVNVIVNDTPKALNPEIANNIFVKLD